eukprot:TRINITY_DN3023_c0_g1_i1.p2 TRINITY_DN3023_c0_g1~~TRINITY_DN3023_c0_g1_i1.p2  ORF type:complete len:268 (-),score=77.29 TRINITY_DN3023_c0_g1_i1:843-1592(-)
MAGTNPTFMEEYVSFPVTPSRRLQFGFANAIGGRDSMEDTMLIKGSFRQRDDEDLFGVFDGHSGHEAALFSAKTFEETFAQSLKEVEQQSTQSILEMAPQLEVNPSADSLEPAQIRVALALHWTFQRVTQRIKNDGVPGGTTALITFFKGDDLYLANVGDTRAVLGKKNAETERISIDHRPGELPGERERIVSSGGTISNFSVPRVEGILAISRSIGDFDLEEKGIILGTFHPGRQRVLQNGKIYDHGN